MRVTSNVFQISFVMYCLHTLRTYKMPSTCALQIGFTHISNISLSQLNLFLQCSLLQTISILRINLVSFVIHMATYITFIHSQYYIKSSLLNLPLLNVQFCSTEYINIIQLISRTLHVSETLLSNNFPFLLLETSILLSDSEIKYYIDP